MSSSSSSVDKGECGLCGWGQTSKLCISCAQKIEQANADISNGLDSHNSSGIDTVLDSLGRIDLSNDDIEKMRISKNKLFADPPPKEDCPICMLPMPHASSGCGVTMVYMPCCGKMLCHGCLSAAAKEIENGNMKEWCAFCRLPLPNTNKELMKRIKKRLKLNDALAFLDLGMQYRDGYMGLPQNMNKALELWNRSAELGSCNAHACLATAYYHGESVEEDKEKGIQHWMLAAIGGHEHARHNLGIMEGNKGNISQAMKHFMIAARCGYDDSLKKIGEGYKAGYFTKEEYAATLRAYQVSIDEMKSDERAKSAQR